jgi:hypothetical protein
LHTAPLQVPDSLAALTLAHGCAQQLTRPIGPNGPIGPIGPMERAPPVRAQSNMLHEPAVPTVGARGMGEGQVGERAWEWARSAYGGL